MTIDKQKVLKELLETNLDMILSLWGESSNFSEKVESAKAVSTLSTTVLKILAELPNEVQETSLPELTLLKAQKTAMLDFLKNSGEG